MRAAECPHGPARCFFAQSCVMLGLQDGSPGHRASRREPVRAVSLRRLPPRTKRAAGTAPDSRPWVSLPEGRWVPPTSEMESSAWRERGGFGVRGLQGQRSGRLATVTRQAPQQERTAPVPPWSAFSRTTEGLASGNQGGPLIQGKGPPWGGVGTGCKTGLGGYKTQNLIFTVTSTGSRT